MSLSKRRKAEIFMCPNPNCSKPSSTGYRGYGRFEDHLNVYDNCNQFWRDMQDQKLPATDIQTGEDQGNLNIFDDFMGDFYSNINSTNMNARYSDSDSKCSASSLNTLEPLDNKDFCSYTQDHKRNLELIQLLDEMNCPDYAFQSVMEWCRKAYISGYKFDADLLTRKA